ncbi:hypothetical protein Bdiaspc4_04100 [Bradyrhizobium diazoefficiens]|nr:hypothetical protein Bdiaspc4_04100 [Bradyrhizobium diazoefficiens]
MGRGDRSALHISVTHLRALGRRGQERVTDQKASGEAYQAAHDLLGDGADRDIRIVEAAD